MKVKIFEASTAFGLERETNQWLNTVNNISIKFVQAGQAKSKSQYSSSDGMSIFIFYELTEETGGLEL